MKCYIGCASCQGETNEPIIVMSIVFHHGISVEKEKIVKLLLEESYILDILECLYKYICSLLYPFIIKYVSLLFFLYLFSLQVL
jgi:hypothetical protein